MADEQIDFFSVCRLCCGQQELCPVFVADVDHSKYSTAISVISGIRVTPNDGLPQKICTKCVLHLNNSIEFRKISQETDLKFRQVMKLQDRKQHNLENDRTTDRWTEEEPKIDNSIETHIKEELDLEIRIQRCKAKSENDLEDTVDFIKPEPMHNQESIQKFEESIDREQVDGEHFEGDPLEKLEVLGCEVKSENDSFDTVDYIKVEPESIQKFHGSIDHEQIDGGKLIERDPLEKVEFISEEQSSDRVNCGLCGKDLTTRSLEAHMMTQHPGVDTRRKKCDFCFKYILKSKLERHLKLMHAVGVGDLNVIKCGYCKLEFERKEELVDHTKACEKRKRKPSANSRTMVNCDLCGKEMQKASLRLHKRVTHSGLGPVCEHCGKKFANKLRLKEHCRSRHGYEKFKCTHCEFQCASDAAMKNHERKHRGEKPFVCETCGAKFHASYLLSQHRQSHRPEKSFKCTQCPASFRTNNTLHMHKKTNHSKFFYKCFLCDRFYNCRHYAVKHLRQRHEFKEKIGPLEKVAQDQNAKVKTQDGDIEYYT